MLGTIVSRRPVRRTGLYVFRLALGIWLCATRAASAGPAAQLHRFEFKHPAMGTEFSLSLYATVAAQAETAARAAFKRVEDLEDIMSDYQADSELMQLLDKPPGQPVPVSADLFDVFLRAEKLSELSHGAFDVTVGPYVRLWRFSRKRKVLPTQAELASAARAVGYRKLRLDPRHRTVTLLEPNMRLDLGGIAKGYAADQALKLLKSHGLSHALVAASGDIAIGDPPPDQRGWKIGIAAIDARTNNTTRVLVLHNCGISTSGDTEQFIEIGGVRYSHILNPATGLGLTNRIQASVVAADATTTDAAATTVCVLGVSRGLAFIDSLPGAAALILTKNGEVKQNFESPRFKTLPVAQ
jgi:FAD:protein FMN transferase